MLLAMGYEWLESALDQLKGVEPHEVGQVLAADRRWPRRAVADTGVTVMTVWGRTRAGRPLIVAVKQVDTWDWLIVGARGMRPDEAASFEAWEARND
jgi:hypothetical protein